MSTVKKIYSDRCWLNGKLQPATVCIEGSVISTVITEKLADAIDVGNKILMPGVIDVHVHINEPGRTEWEGFETATKAAAAGGTTTIIDMPLNASPVTTTIDAFEQKLDSAKDKLHVNVGFYAGLIPGNTNELPALIEAGVLGVKCFLVHSGIDEFPNVTKQDMDEAMPVIRKYHVPLLAHCEIYNEEVRNDFENNTTSYQHYLGSRPKQWENDAVELMISLCRKHNCATHIVHVASCEALDPIRKAKKEGLPLTAETCSHYICFNAEDIPDHNCVYKCAPPIREKANNEKLKQALLDGTLDFITTDHSPAPPAIKEIESGNLKKAWGGIAGLQFLLTSSWTAMKDIASIEKIIPLLTEHPAAFIKVNNRKGFIKAGYDADLVVWDPEAEETIFAEDVWHRHKLSPYIGMKLSGKIERTYVNGELVYADKQFADAGKKNGKIILRDQ